MILLDTCAVLWLAGEQDRLSPKAREAIRRHSGAVYVSAATALEVGLKVRRGALELQVDPASWYARVLRVHSLKEIPITGEIAARAAMLPGIHKDPCDRLIIASALQGKMTILSADTIIPQYPGVEVLW